MAVGGFATLYCSLLESFKSLLTSQDFGSEYELLCAELAIQSLRVRLWGESIGLDINASDSTPHSLLDREDATPAIAQVLNNISFLLTEIKIIRQKYQPRPALEVPSSSDVKMPDTLESLRRLPGVNCESFRKRIRANQKQKSIVAITKWALRDARKFNEKVKRLKGLIDGLEDISRVAGIDQASDVSTSQDESPPRYSAIGLRTPQATPRVEIFPSVESRATVPTSRFSSSSTDSELREHYTAMKRFLAALPSNADHSIPRGREKLARLSSQQFKELRIDVFDELIRRQYYELSPTIDQYLPNIPSLHPKRNEARKKLSTLITNRFGHLITDIVAELERRFSFLQREEEVTPAIPAFEYPDPFFHPRSLETRRWGCVGPPPFLQYRPAHQSTISFPPATTTSLNLNHYKLHPTPSPPPTKPTAPTETTTNPTIQIMKSFRVSPSHSTADVLPLAMKKYNIEASWESYALVVVYGDRERCLGLEERPLSVFKRLEREHGCRPVFWLRKRELGTAGRVL